MNVENELKKDGITIIKPLDTLSITLIAKFVAEKFMSFFPFSRFHYHDLFVKISRLNMYIADIPEGMSEANYFYKNSTIYFKDGLTMDEMKELTIHEFIHHFQEIATTLVLPPGVSFASHELHVSRIIQYRLLCIWLL